MQTYPLVRDLVLVGGGHSHALILRMWGMNPLPGARLTLINPDPIAPYTGMLPGFVAGHYRRDEMMIDLVRLCRFAGAALILDRACGIDPGARHVLLEGGAPVPFDTASVNVGATSDLPGLPGFAAHGHAAKPLGDFAAEWESFVKHATGSPRVTVIGGGVAGVELALAARHRLGPAARLTLIEQSPAILSGLPARARNALGIALSNAGINILTGLHPASVGADHIRLSDGRTLPSDFTLSAAGARPPAWLAGTGLHLTEGFLTVDATLQTSTPAIFAAGDCAHLPDPRPKAGVFAVRQAPALFHNLRAALAGRGNLRPFRPQRDYLKLISTGTKSAVATRSGLTLHGPRMWALKDRIDRRFMTRLSDLPAMPTVPLPALAAEGMATALGTQMPCGGCGAKAGAGTLAPVLAALPAAVRPEVLSGPGDDAAILRTGAGTGAQVITTDHLRSLTHDARLMARIAAIHTLGDIWAMGAAPQGALAQIILPRMSPALQARTLAAIMEAAGTVFRAEGADILGGHTSLGEELTIGFTVTGLTERPVTKSGARPGDLLILTKPLGSGTVLAAEMAGTRLPGLLTGELVAAAHASMIRPMGAVSARLAPIAHAMTDVTGFGLAGHLLEILRASGCGARISLAALPLLPGAEALAAHGTASTLAPENRAACAPAMTFPESPRAALLFDPQTCGGLLAAVPADALNGLPEGLTVIGQVTEGPPHLVAEAGLQ